MAVPKEYQALFNRWCAERAPGPARATLQITYTIHGDQVTIAQRRPPRFPELNSAWSSTPIAQLRHNDPELGLWRLYRRVEDDWQPHEHRPETAPDLLLAEIAATTWH